MPVERRVDYSRASCPGLPFGAVERLASEGMGFLTSGIVQTFPSGEQVFHVVTALPEDGPLNPPRVGCE